MATTRASPPQPTLSADLRFTYVAEGGANVLFRIGPGFERPAADDAFRSGTPPPSELEPWQAGAVEDGVEDAVKDGAALEGTALWQYDPTAPAPLLRVRKAVPGATPVAAALDDFDAHIAPLLREDAVVAQRRVRLGAGVVQTLNGVLEALERADQRPARRRGTYISDDTGALLPDMGVRSGLDAAALELKPKWLVQSAEAPRGATRCRTCALRAKRAEKGEEQTPRPCPLRLLPGRAGYDAVLRSVMAEQGIGEALVARLSEFFAQPAGLIASLRDLQDAYGTGGMLAAKDADLRLRIAMTLRDCALFIRIPIDPRQHIEARLADLDLKSPDKLARWQALETSLVEGGWYFEDGASPVTQQAPCVLSET